MLNWLRCPRCTAALEESGSALSCRGCSRHFPILGGVFCLLSDPALFRAQWFSRLEDYLQVTESRIRFMRGETELSGLLPRTQARLRRIIEAKSNERIRIEELFGSLKSGALHLPSSVVPSRPEALGGRLAVLEWYEHLFRDWVWGDRENARLCELVLGLTPRAPEILVVFGAGAGRLAFDVHRALSPGRTLALDINPLPLLVAERLVRGGTLDLHEFPVAPTTEEHMVVLQHLRAPATVDERFSFAFADALSPPFSPGTADAVLTPWFVDAIDLDFRETAAIINRALRPGGLWIELGPLNFNTVLSRAYSIEEVHDLTSAAGFRVLSRLQQRVRYFDSPMSGSLREETVYGFCAEKQDEAATVDVPTFVPPWVTEPALPIPVTPELFAMGRTSAFTAMVISMIDGTRSILDIAAALAASLGVDEQAMREELRAFFSKLSVT